MRKLMLIAALAAAPALLVAVPRAASAADPGVRLAQWDGGHDDERHHAELEHQRDLERERAQRWESFHRDRMHEHSEHDGYRWASLPDHEKEGIIRGEWDRWGEHNWGR